MLVLSRKAGESIKIGDEITVVIHRISGSRVTLGLDAPRNLRIIRGELKPFDEIEPLDAVSGSPEETLISISIDTGDEPVTRLRHQAH